MGKEFVAAFVLSGASCAVIDQLGAEYDAVLAEVRAEALAHFGSLDKVPMLLSYVCDVTAESQVQATVAQIAEDFDGRIDVLVTSAGVVENICVEKYPLERFKKVLDVSKRYILQLRLAEVGGTRQIGCIYMILCLQDPWP